MGRPENQVVIVEHEDRTADVFLNGQKLVTAMRYSLDRHTGSWQEVTLTFLAQVTIRQQGADAAETERFYLGDEP